MSTSPKTKKERVFKTQISKKLALLALLPLSAASALAYFAFDASSKFAPGDPSKIFFVSIPACIALAILLTILFVCNHFLGRTITLRKDELTYQDNKVLMTLEIGEMAFSPPSKDAQFKTVMFSDGNTFVQIPELFMKGKEFDLLVTVIKKLRSQVKNDPNQKTWSL